MNKAYLILEDKTVFEGFSIGASGQVTGTIKPYNGMTGYQEFITDPTCFGDIICMTYPIIGSVGTANQMNSSEKVQAKGIVVRELNPHPSSSSSEKSFDEWLKENGCVGICGVDTRSIIRHLKNFGKMNAVITTVENPDINISAETASMYIPENIPEKVSVKEPKTILPKLKHKKTVCVLDLGISRKEIDSLILRGVKLVLLPYNSSPEKVDEYKPDGLYISNGPEVSRFDLIPLYQTLKTLKNKYPVLACGNGHNAIAQSHGIIPEDMKSGHHGVNYPVIDTATGVSYITTQNHRQGFIESDIYKKYNIEITHKNINDGTVEGFKYSEKSKSVQFMPDSETTDFNTGYIWDSFISDMSK